MTLLGPVDTVARQHSPARVRLAVLQKHVQLFRVPIFERLSLLDQTDLTVLSGSRTAVPESKFAFQRVRSFSLPLGSRSTLIHPRPLYDGLRGRYDAIICEGSARVLTSVLLALARPLTTTRVIWWGSLYDGKRRRVGIPKGLKGQVLRRALRNADAFIAYSSDAARCAIEEARVAPNRVFIAPNVLDTDVLMGAERAWRSDPPRLSEFRRANGFEGRHVILFVGRLLESKRVDDLLVAFRLIRARLLPHRPLLVVVGSGPAEQRLRTLASDLDVADDVRFYGEIRAPEDVCPFFLSARAFVLPGPGGLAVYHALAHGVPTIATVADGTERDLVLPGRNGYLVEPGDVVNLANRAEILLTASPEHWAAFSEVAKKVARDDMHVVRMIAAFEAALTRAAST
jgi:glycosyltransferase involved in cell wall biosynthesis